MSGVSSPSLAGRGAGRAAERRTVWLLIVAAALAEATAVGFWAAGRGVNADEGFYLAAGRHVAEGLRIYADFFFPQMPYLPWLEGALFQWFEPSLGAGRAVSVVAATLCAGLLAALAWKESRSAVVTLFVSFLYVASALLLGSQSVLKTAALSNLLVLTAFALATGANGGLTCSAMAGVAMGCAIGVRLPLAPVALLLALVAARQGPRVLGAFVAGGIAASLPWIVVALRSPAEFLFCNFGFHTLRREISGWGPIVMQKLGILAKWLLLPQHALVWGLAGYGLWRAPRRVWPAASSVAVVAAAYAAATPTYLEYMSQFLPFLLLAAVPAVATLARRPVILLVIAALYLAGLYPLLRSPERGTTTAAERALWSRDTVDAVATFVRGATEPGDVVLSWWEGYPVLSGRPGVRGVGFWESNVARKLDAERARRFHVVGRERIRDLVRRREPTAIVVADGVWKPMRADIEAGYRAARRVDAVQIYLRRDGG